jgi:hypothetical protein
MHTKEGCDMILVVNFILKDPFAVLWKLYQESLKRCTASKEINMKLPPKVVDIPGSKVGILVVLLNAGENMTGRKTLLELILNIRCLRIQFLLPVWHMSKRRRGLMVMVLILHCKVPSAFLKP